VKGEVNGEERGENLFARSKLKRSERAVIEKERKFKTGQ